jgi:hypothetical protein
MRLGREGAERNRTGHCFWDYLNYGQLRSRPWYSSRATTAHRSWNVASLQAKLLTRFSTRAGSTGPVPPSAYDCHLRRRCPYFVSSCERALISSSNTVVLLRRLPRHTAGAGEPMGAKRHGQGVGREQTAASKTRGREPPCAHASRCCYRGSRAGCCRSHGGACCFCRDQYIPGTVGRYSAGLGVGQLG